MIKEQLKVLVTKALDMERVGYTQHKVGKQDVVKSVDEIITIVKVIVEEQEKLSRKRELLYRAAILLFGGSVGGYLGVFGDFL